MLYEYVCDKCDFVESYFHKMDETPEFLCEKCGEKMRKALGLSFILKANGFYSKGRDIQKSQKIKQTVMGVPQEKVKDLDPKIQKMQRAVPKDPTPPS